MTYNWPPLDIIIITYNRYADIQRTVDSLAHNLCYPLDKLRWLIADDATPGNYVARLKKLPLFQDIHAEFIPAEKNVGWGANANRALAYSTAPIVYQQEDDYELIRPIDLRLGVALLLEKANVLGMLRYRGTAGDRVLFHQFEANIEPYIPGFREQMGQPGMLTYLQLDGHSPSAYLYSNGPHLKTRRFHEVYGLYPEGRRLGDTEETMAVRVKGMMQTEPDKCPGIAILPENVPMIYDHFGISFQHSEADNAR